MGKPRWGWTVRRSVRQRQQRRVGLIAVVVRLDGEHPIEAGREHIPSLAAFIEFIMLLVMSEDEFSRKFNGGASYSATSVKDSTSALSDLKRLYDEGVITAEEYEEKRRKC